VAKAEVTTKRRRQMNFSDVSTAETMTKMASWCWPLKTNRCRRWETTNRCPRVKKTLVKAHVELRAAALTMLEFRRSGST